MSASDRLPVSQRGSRKLSDQTGRATQDGFDDAANIKLARPCLAGSLSRPANTDPMGAMGESVSVRDPPPGRVHDRPFAWAG